MMVWTTEQVAKVTGAPYRQLLHWVETGWFKPMASGGEHRKYHLFNDDDVWEVQWFETIRHRFHPREWPSVIKAIHEIRMAGGGRRFIAGVQSPQQKKAPVEYRVVSGPDIGELIAAGALVFLV